MARIAKAIGWLVAGLAAVAVVAMAGGALLASHRLSRSHPIRTPGVPPIPVGDASSIAEGKRLFAARGCAGCHGFDGGGKVAIRDPFLGILHGTNLTSGKGGIGDRYTEADFVRAVQDCVRPDGRSLLLMPCRDLRYLPEPELASILAWWKSLPPVDREWPEDQELGFAARILLGWGLLDLVSAEQVEIGVPIPEAPPPSPTAEYGERLARIQCVGCHGPGLSGGSVPGLPRGLPVPANLTFDRETGLRGWTQVDFVQMLRSGKRPDGSEVHSFMPWQTFQYMNDTEMSALWAYLRSVPPRPFGSR